MWSRSLKHERCRRTRWRTYGADSAVEERSHVQLSDGNHKHWHSRRGDNVSEHTAAPGVEVLGPRQHDEVDVENLGRI